MQKAQRANQKAQRANQKAQRADIADEEAHKKGEIVIVRESRR
jgi:hypothetical protein